jgi:putative polysaccharide lyase
MTAVKKKLLIALAFVAMLFAGIALLSACSGNEDDLKVTFMVQEDGGEWGSYREADIVDGSVEMPENPTKLYYNFSNWYYTQDGTGDPFENSGITESVTVYARFVPIEVEIVINGTNEGTQNLVDVVNNTYDPGEGLEFSGWYTNANFTESTKWDGESVVTTLYARSVARITFNNGYEDVYTTTVAPGTVFTDPASADGIEATEIRKDYMSKHDIAYWDEDGNEFDFSEPVTQNTNITVTWRSPFLAYEVNNVTGNLRLTMYRSNEEYIYDDTETAATASTVPVISIPGELTFDKDGDGAAETYKVEEVNLNGALLSGSVIEKLIIGEGVSIVQNINSSTACTVKEISLPSTLKVIINCFNNLNALESVELPEGVEVIIGSFWANCNAGWNGLAGLVNLGEAYSFEIAVPSSVKNLSMVPSNFTYSATKSTAKTGDFYRDGNYVYKIDDAEGHEGDLLLVADFSEEGGSLSVPEGVEGIQVGTYFNRTYEYFVLPSSFSYIGYNADASDYAAYTFDNSAYSGCNHFLWDDQYASNPRGNIAAAGYAVFNNMDALTNLVFNGDDPEGSAADFAFMGDPTGYGSMMETQLEPYTATSYTDVVVYIGEVAEPQVTITLENELTGKSYTATITKKKNESLTIEEILNAVDDANNTTFAEAYSTDKVLTVSGVTAFGQPYDLSETLTTNVYLTVVTDYEEIDSGYIAVDNGDGTATITGYAGNGYTTADGLVIISIPNEVTVNGKQLTVTAIADGAFDATKNSACINIGYVRIPSSVKTIGNKAFYMCEGLVSVDIVPGGLEKIGVSAFEGTSLVTVAVPLANLKEVGAYAFKIETLEQFLPAEGEEDRDMLTKTDLKEGDFFIRQDVIGVDGYTPIYGGYGLYQYVGKTTTDGVITWNVKFVASAGAVNANEDIVMISLGDVTDSTNIISYEIMEGSFYYINSETSMSSTITFYSVSKIHQNAFTDSAIGGITMQYSSDYMGEFTGSTLAEFIAANQSVFEDGWYEGYTEEGMGADRVTES